jgi:hypothetical protein
MSRDIAEMIAGCRLFVLFSSEYFEGRSRVWLVQKLKTIAPFISGSRPYFCQRNLNIRRVIKCIKRE